MPVNREIVYPIFLECCSYATDTFWESVFEDLVYGKPPFGTYITKDFLCCNIKNKEFSYKIENKDPEILYNQIYELLNKKAGILSRVEQITQKKAFTDMEENINDSLLNWNDIRKKNIKELLIELYVIRMKKEHNLTLNQTKYLHSVILMAIVFKVITSSDIIYSDNKINSINGIEFVNNDFIIKKDMYYNVNNFTINDVLCKKSFPERWEKFLKELRKLSSKRQIC